tara:strand:- start:13530 stop:13727 length:198 start_codon:yes stop_codon:yes gene_type:complete
MNLKKILAIVLVILGIILITYGITEFNSIESQFTRALGQKDNNAVGSIVAGAISVIIGLYLLVRK